MKKLMHGASNYTYTKTIEWGDTSWGFLWVMSSHAQRNIWLIVVPVKTIVLRHSSEFPLNLLEEIFSTRFDIDLQ